LKIVHVINGLANGGAEHTLYKICKYDTKNKHIVISLTDKGKYFLLLKKIKVKVYILNYNFFSIHKFFYLTKLLYDLKPNIVQSWLVHSDFVASFAARLIGIKNIIWNIRYSNLIYGKTKLTTIILLKFLAKLSFIIPKAIIIVSKNSKFFFTTIGYNSKIFEYIPNGYDLKLLKSDKSLKSSFKKKNKIKKNVPIIGNVGRLDPQKDHINLLKALSILKSKNISFLCILAGKNINNNNLNLTSLIKQFKVQDRVKLLGQNKNIPELMNGFDIYVQSSSYGEGFPNVVAEAMACGTTCVVTNVGDASFIVGSTGWVAPPNNAFILADKIKKAIDELNAGKWNRRSRNSRLRIKNKFSIKKMINNYNNIWTKVFSKN
jgi:glycosyltransferase involved in cell wall biosynthesis